jgi:adenylate cyclase
VPWLCAACSGANPDGTRFCGRCGAERGAGEGAELSPVVADPIRGLVVSEPGDPREPGRALRAERRLVTVLFADISGFSELTGRLDAEQLLEVIDPVVSTLSNVVSRYGGVVEKYAGDAILALFGAPVAHDDDAARALRVALEMHRELAALVPGLGPDAAGLRLHAGVNSGHGIGRLIGSDVRLDYGVLGDVVVLAQRLEAAAPSGETYVGATTYELARKEFDFEPLGELTVKGKAEPVQAWRLLGPREARPGPRSSSDGPSLVGREDELASIVSFSSRLADARGGAVFVLGEAGLGKSTLCDAVRARLAGPECDWLAARCVSYGAELAYWPFADLLRRLFRLGEAAHEDVLGSLREQLEELGLEETLPFVGALCGVDAAPATELGAQSFQGLHESVVAVLRALAGARPTVLHLDDLHWADGPTLALLRDVLGATHDTPLLLLVSARPEAAALVDELADRSGAPSARLQLGPLADDGVQQIAAAILGGPPAAGLVEALVERTQGNPFFVEEVTRSLAERGELVQRGGAWHTSPDWAGEQVPLTVEGILAARVDALPQRERDALEVLSIVGRRADRELARRIDDGIEPAVPALVAAGLLDPPAEPGHVLAFHHPLIQQVVYSRLLRRRRADLHRTVGETAELLHGADDAWVDLLARHFYLGERADKAYPYLLRAAERAERLFANEQALSHLERALELVEQLPDAGGERPELLLRCAGLEEVRGRYPQALALYGEVLESTGDIRAALGEAATLRKLGDYERCLATLARARAAHPEPSPPEAAALALEEGWVLGLRGENHAAADVLENGFAAIAGSDDQLEGQVLVVLARTLELIDRADGALERAERARLLFERPGDLPRLAMTLRVLGGVQHDLAGDERDGLQGARETLEQGLALARRVGNAEERAASLINLSQVLAELGELDAAIEADREALAAFRSVGLKAGVAWSYCNLAEHYHDAGLWQESREAAGEGLAVAEEIDSPYWASGALIGIAQAELATGNAEAAVAAAEDAAERALAHTLTARGRSALKAAIAAHEALGNTERAEELRRRVAALA